MASGPTVQRNAAPGFRNAAGLVWKRFLRSHDCRTTGGVYPWNDERAGHAFMSECVAPMIREKFHYPPSNSTTRL